MAELTTATDTAPMASFVRWAYVTCRRTFPISGADARCDVSIECHNDEENQHAHADPLSSKVLFEGVGCDFPSD